MTNSGYPDFDPEQFRWLRELNTQLLASINASATRELAKTTETVRSAFDVTNAFKFADPAASVRKMMSDSATIQLSQVMRQNQETMRHISEGFRFTPLVPAAQLSTFRNWGLDTGAFQAAAAALRPLAPDTVNVDRLKERAAEVTTVEEAEEAVEQAFTSLDPVAAAELAAKLAGAIATFLALLETLGYDTKAAAALMAFIAAMCWIWAHVEQHTR